MKQKMTAFTGVVLAGVVSLLCVFGSAQVYAQVGAEAAAGAADPSPHEVIRATSNQLTSLIEEEFQARKRRPAQTLRQYLQIISRKNLRERFNAVQQ